MSEVTPKNNAPAASRKRPHKKAPGASTAGDAGQDEPPAQWIRRRLEAILETALRRPRQLRKAEEQICQQRTLIEGLDKESGERKRQLEKQEAELEKEKGVDTLQIVGGDLMLSLLELDSCHPRTGQEPLQACHLILLRKQEAVWLWVKGEFMRTCWPAVKVRNILRIKNRSLTDAFSRCHPAGDVEPLWMFHGTPRKNVHSICTVGFDGGPAQKTWFAKQASYLISFCEEGSPMDDTLFMFLAKVYVRDCHGETSVASNLDSLPVYLIEFSI